MISFIKKHIPGVICLGLAIIHLCITFFTDKLIFLVPMSTNLSDAIICKILAGITLFFLYYGAYLIIFKGIVPSAKSLSEVSDLYKIFLSALPYLLIIIAACIIKLPGGYLSNDETLIVEGALNLQHYTWFYYITVYFYIVSFMIFPTYLGPIFMKLIIEFFVVGYVVYRIKKLYGKPYWYFGYALFLLYPVIAYTTSAHRLPIYFLLYILLIAMLIFDGIEKVKLSIGKAAFLIFLGAILTQWRTEGIYLAVIVPILMLFTYSNLRNIKNAVLLVISTIILQYLVSVPQNGLVAKEMGAAADDRMKPFYAYTITNMYRNGLDEEKNAEDLAIVDKYLAIDKIYAINEHYGDINYEDVLILYEPDFIGVREEATVTDFFNYAGALKRIFKNNIAVFLKTRIGAFCYAALPYHIEFGSGIVSLGISVVKAVLYNLFIPLAIIVLICIYSLIKKKWFSFFLTGGVIAHWFIVFILAPASYFKYYFPVYITSYFYLLMIILTLFYNRKGSDKVSIIR